jgi:hypothetical protein
MMAAILSTAPGDLLSAARDARASWNLGCPGIKRRVLNNHSASARRVRV